MLKEVSEEFVKGVNSPLDPGVVRTNYSGEKFINSYVVTRILNKLTNGAWDFTIDKTWVEKCDDKGKEKDVYHMLLTLNCYFDNGHGGVIKISKTGAAGKVLEAGTKNAANIYKALESLAIRKAASYFGVGAELWLNDDEVDYFEQEDAEPIWTEELMTEHMEAWQTIDEIQKKYELTEEDINGMVQMWDDTYDTPSNVPPEKIDEFAAFLKQQADSAGAADAEEGAA